MSDTEVKWGGMIGEVLADSCVATENVRCFGQGTLQTADAAAFAESVGYSGDDPGISAWVAYRVLNAIKRDVGERIASGVPIFTVVDDERTLAQNLGAAMTEILQPLGASLRVEGIHVVIDEPTREFLLSQAAPVAIAAIAPGSHVLARWTDGRTYGASVRGFDGTNYEIAWDGASAVAWVPAAAVRLG